ncbi:hypothetical protein D0864_05177 [Hortaea werneckii]|uniref:Uncharacterized protein n=2 Tax=Hortaea werneckii TaxID=91943 RepID=A0A3M7EHU2_HORWE|nr:hypothetical protein D0863_02205 [Hortaea werneckii]RMY96378.1 hypothetical protein D0864_05177 [Hortaea werneckii]
MQSTRFLAANVLRAQPSRMTPMLRTQQATRGFRTVGRQMRPMPKEDQSGMFRLMPSPFQPAPAPAPAPMGKQKSSRAERRTQNAGLTAPLNLLCIAHTISQRLRQLKRIPPELIPLGVVLAAAVFAAGYSMVRKLYTDSTLRLYRQGPDANKH